jgi:general secretion pathway protein K
MKPRRSRERGIALLLVLWIFMVLGVIALDFARYMRDDAMAAVNFAEETQGYYLALAGMNRAIYEADLAHEAHGVGGVDSQGTAAEVAEDEDVAENPVDGQWHDGEFAGGHYSVRMTDQAGYIPLNSKGLTEELLTRIVTTLIQGPGANATSGVDRRTSNDVAIIVDSILDWRDADHLKRAHGAENDYYLKRRPSYRAKDDFFSSIEELLLVRGVTPALFYGSDGMPGMRDIFTVYVRGPLKMHYKASPPAVLQVLLGLDADGAAEMATLRDTDSNAFITRLIAQMSTAARDLSGLSIEQQGEDDPRTVMIEAKGDSTAARNQSNVAAIIDLSNESAEGAKVIRWFDRAPWDGAIVPGGPARGDGEG